MAALSVESQLPFVNRKAELSLLTSQLTRPRLVGGQARTTLIHGPGGVGKSKLARQAIETLSGYDIVVERACSPEEQTTPFALFSGIVTRLSASALESGFPGFEQFLRGGGSN